jgi:hypothetical protein
MSTCLSCHCALSGGLDTAGDGYCLPCWLEAAELATDCRHLFDAITDMGYAGDSQAVERLAWQMLDPVGALYHPALPGLEATHA